MIRATPAYLFVGLYILLIAPFGMVWTLLSRNPAFMYSVARFGIRMAGWLAGVRVQAHGLEKIQPAQNYVFLSNHQANLDGPLLMHVIPKDVKAVIKKEMMRIPVLSLVMRLARFVPIDRSSPTRARRSIESGARLLKDGHSLIAFPEGTRSRDGRMGPFKKGIFTMVLMARAPVMPVTILNSRRVQPTGSWSIHPGTVEVVFHDPVFTDRMRPEDRERLAELTRAAIASRLSDQERRAESTAPPGRTAGERL